MSIIEEIRQLLALLSHTNRWYIVVSHPDTQEFITLAEKVKERIDRRLSHISFFSLWRAFVLWRRSVGAHPPKDYYYSFLSSLSWDLGYKSLKGYERDLYSEVMNVKIKFF